jgi:hypothetical protein
MLDEGQTVTADLVAVFLVTVAAATAKTGSGMPTPFELWPGLLHREAERVALLGLLGMSARGTGGRRRQLRPAPLGDGHLWPKV